MAEVVVRSEIGAPAARVWDVVSDFGGLLQWAAGVESCRVDGEGVGAVRTLGIPGGLELQERLESWDAAARQYSYAIVNETPLPFTGYLSTFTVEEAGDEGCTVTWRGRFEPTGDEAAAAGIIRGIYTGGLASLGKHLGVDVREL
jgi:hypothetical protein